MVGNYQNESNTIQNDNFTNRKLIVMHRSSSKHVRKQGCKMDCEKLIAKERKTHREK